MKALPGKPGERKYICQLISVTSPPTTKRKLPGTVRSHRQHATGDAQLMLSI